MILIRMIVMGWQTKTKRVVDRGTVGTGNLRMVRKWNATSNEGSELILYNWIM